MISENKQAPGCDIRFGISGLRHPSLNDHFYPSDLPDDWLLDYYSNEFRLILLSPSDLEVALVQAVTELCDDIEDEEFIAFLDVSEISEDSVKQLLNDFSNDAQCLYLINLQNVHTETTPQFSIPLAWKKCQGESDYCLFYFISEQPLIEPPELKKLIEQIREQANIEQVGSVNVVFSSQNHALENCRNAILLESMM